LKITLSKRKCLDYLKCEIKKGRATFDPAYGDGEDLRRIYFFKNFFLPYPANPINPEPRSNIVAGSGVQTN
jgi:hypothetical protein